MALPKPEKTTISQVLKLITQLTSEEQEQLVQEIKLQELRREVTIGVEQLARGEKISGEQVFKELRERHDKKVCEKK